MVAIDLDGGPAFLQAVRRAWDRGDAVLPLGPSLPRAWRDLLISKLKPTSIVDDESGPRSLMDGAPTERGDALVIATSGTTGSPKGVVLTHEALDHAADASIDRLGCGAGDTWLACLPLHHIGGLSVVTRAWRSAAALVVHPRFDATAVELAADAGATHVSLVSTAMARIDPTRFAAILLGGSAIPMERPANCVATYGMSESAGGVVYDGLPLGGVDTRIDPDGTIAIRSPTLLRCYRDGTDPKSVGGWYRTGDLGLIDDAGSLTVHGRADDVIITGGENVWPEPIEAILRAHPLIADVAVIGEPDPEWGSRVVAVIVAVDPVAVPTLDDIRDQTRDLFPAPWIPKSVRIVDRLPRTALGKLRRRDVAPASRGPSCEPREQR